jgi:lysine 2,3-aminomutase
MRKRKVGRPETFSTKFVDQGIAYIRSHPEVRDVLLSGGDPLLLSDIRMAYLLRELRGISHVEIIRIGTKVPCALPQRITPALCAVLRKYEPVYVNTHFNHPDEVTPEAKRACEMLTDAGVPVSNQCVLLKGINDNAETIKRLMRKLLMIRVKPYYLFQADLVKGTDHFRTPIQKGLEIVSALWGHTSGLALPHFAVDAPGGGGKIPLFPETLVGFEDGEVLLKNYEKKTCVYPNPEETGETVRPFHV